MVMIAIAGTGCEVSGDQILIIKHAHFWKTHVICKNNDGCL